MRRSVLRLSWLLHANSGRAQTILCAAWGLVLIIFLHAGNAYGGESSFENDPRLAQARKTAPAEALPLFRELTKSYPQAPAAWFELGDALFAVKQFAEALECYAKARTLGAPSAALWVRSGKTLLRMERFPDAEAAFQEALKLEPTSLGAHSGLGTSLFKQQKLDAALVEFEALATRNDEWGGAALEYLGLLYTETKQPGKAVKVLAELLTKQPKDLYYRWLYARALYKAKRYADALPEFRRVAQESPERAEAARYYQAACLEGLGHAEEARQLYRESAKGSSEWAESARQVLRDAEGQPYRIYVDSLIGYDTAIVQPGDNDTFVGGKDFYEQTFADFSGRIVNQDKFNWWLGVEHFNLTYKKLNNNDYYQDTAKSTFNVSNAGPFYNVAFEYRLSYAQFDYQAYEQVHEGEVCASWKHGPNRVNFGIEVGAHHYFRDSEGLTGMQATLFVDYRRELPGWDHELRVRANLDQRWTEDPTVERQSERLRLQYRSKICGKLYGQVEFSARYDDYMRSHGFGDPRRVDRRYSVEPRLEYQLQKHLFLNAGYLYEWQDSSRQNQEYRRHQVDLGLSISF